MKYWGTILATALLYLSVLAFLVHKDNIFVSDVREDIEQMEQQLKAEGMPPKQADTSLLP